MWKGQTANTEKISKAFIKAQSEFKGAIKKSDNPAFAGSKYADLESVFDSCMKQLHANGLALLQPLSSREPGEVTVTTILLHESGQKFWDSVSVRLPKGDAWTFGSFTSYLKRYSAESFLGLARKDDDDDGNAASASAVPPSADAGTTEGEKTPDTPPPAEENEDSLRDYLDSLCVEIGKLKGGDGPGVLYSLTVKMVDGNPMYGKTESSKVPYKLAKKDGTDWSPLKATIKKAEEELELASKESFELDKEGMPPITGKEE